MSYICGIYNKKAQRIEGLVFVVSLKEELADGYVPGCTLVVGPREYILTDRTFIAAGTVVQYTMVIKKG